MTAIDPFAAETLWFSTRKTQSEGRSCREYHVRDLTGDSLLIARAYTWGRELEISTPRGERLMMVVRSRLFPITGRAIVEEYPGRQKLGTVSRGGRFRDASGSEVGRFVDARSLRSRAAEGLLQGAFELLVSASGESVPSGPDALILLVLGRPAGSLTYGKSPFAAGDGDSGVDSRFERLGMRFVRSALNRLNAPRAWSYRRETTVNGDSRLHLAAALFAAELSRW